MTDEVAVRRAIHWMRRSHSAFTKQGCRLPDTVAGERAYQKWRKRVQRSAAA